MLTLSAFADEIDPDLPEALRVLKDARLSTFELRGFSKTNVTKLTDEQVAFAEQVAVCEGFSVGSVATPIGKVEVTDALEPQLGMMKRCLDVARRLKARHLRLFSFYLPKGDERRKWKKEVHARMERLVTMAKGTGVTVVLENEEGLYGDTVERCAEIIDALDVPFLKLAYDPCNLAIVGPRPFRDSFKLARKHLGYLHVKDWKRDTKTMVPAGQGDAEWPELVGGLAKNGWEGFVALEPHLAAAGQFSGFSGPDLFRKAHEALTGLLKGAGIEYR